MAGWERCSQVRLPQHFIRLARAVAGLWCGVLEQETPFLATFSRIASWQVSRLSTNVWGTALRESVKTCRGEDHEGMERGENSPLNKKTIIRFSYPTPTLQWPAVTWGNGRGDERPCGVGVCLPCSQSPGRMAALFFFLTSFCFGKST